MKRVYIVVEGQTEESFVSNILAPVLWDSDVHPIPILLGRMGGRTSYTRVKRDVVLLLKQDRTAYCSTTIDLYGIGPGYPGMPIPANFTNLEKVRHIEEAVKRDIYDEVPDCRPDVRFIPYLQLHEYEGLLFSDPRAFATAISESALATQFMQIRDSFDSPEDINNGLQSAPSKRVLAVCPSYRKVIEGTLAARSIGIRTIRSECRHFREWLEYLEQLVQL